MVAEALAAVELQVAGKGNTVMKKYKERVLLGIFLVGVSVLLHLVHYFVFRDLHHIFIYLLADIAFVPLEVFFVSLVFERVVEVQRRKEVKKKVFMLIGLFYMELGNEILNILSNADKEISVIAEKLDLSMGWSIEQFKFLKDSLCGFKSRIGIEKIDLEALYDFINAKKDLVVNLIANPALSENSLFSDSMLSVFHLLDELRARDLNNLLEHDINHLKIDAERVYKNLTGDWVLYMEHLSSEYPFLYARAIIDNPFKES